MSVVDFEKFSTKIELLSHFANSSSFDFFDGNKQTTMEKLPSYSEEFLSRIYSIRGQRVMLDVDLAEVYGTTAKRLNEQVRRYIMRFPTEFFFRLTKEVFANLRSQFATSSWGGQRYLPYAFTEHGAVMAASVLNTEAAV
jgi:hypothetical protein